MVAFDVLEAILLRSDANDLLRWKSVCKSWYSLISTPRFVQAHIKIAAANDNHSRIAMPTFWKTVKLPDTILYQRNFWRVAGSSNGLVCVWRRFDGLTLVINPWTREVRALPIAPINPKPVGGFVYLNLSFGYDASSDDYKVVMGFTENPDELLLFQVLSLKSNTWKTIGRFNYSIDLQMCGIMFNGSIYWIVWDPNPPDSIHHVILSFDLSREDFSIIPQPKDSRYLYHTKYLGIMENQLCLYFPAGPQEIWVMRSHDSWEPLPNDCEMTTHHVVHFMNMLEFSSSNRKQERINFVCLDNKCLPKPWKTYSYIFFPSLISPFVNSDARPSHPTNSNTFVNKWSIEVAKAKGPNTQATMAKYLKAFEKNLEEDYRMEVGEAQNWILDKVFIRSGKANKFDENEGFKPEVEWMLDTEGVNLLAVMGHEDVDALRTTSNHVIEVLEVLGMEASRRPALLDAETTQCLNASCNTYVFVMRGSYRHDFVSKAFLSRVIV